MNHLWLADMAIAIHFGLAGFIAAGLVLFLWGPPSTISLYP